MRFTETITGVRVKQVNPDIKLKQSILNDNGRTLAAYQNKTAEYIANTPLGDQNLYKWIDTLLEHVPRTGTIFELGSGLGRDATYIRSLGYTIICSDAVPNFITILRDSGHTAHTLNILTDSIPESHDMILANAVMPHFAPNETAQVLSKVYDALRPGGIFAFSIKKGDGAVWSTEKLGEPRYFYYWQLESLRQLTQENGFEWVDMAECFTPYNKLDWMLITIQKTAQLP